jgi:UDP-N-acetylmuramoyl-tripeptide--D-alanyl-D-alanine ligase
MMPLSLTEITAAVGGRQIGPRRANRITGVSTHSGEVRPGDLFVAMRGAARDGHKFVRDAFERGAVAALVHRSVPRPKGTLIRVRKTGKALLQLAAHYRHRLPMPVIGVTGSVGKTTTKELLFHALGGPGVVSRSKRSFNNHVGLPLSIFQARPDHKALILEIGGGAPGEIGQLAAAAQPKIVVMTMIGEAHLKGFGDLAGVARGKAEALAPLGRDGVALLNGDDPVLRTIARMHRGHTRLYGTGPHSQLRGENLRRTDTGMAVDVLGVTFEVPGLSPTHVSNVIAAVAVSLELGVPLGLAARRLRNFTGAAHRMQVEQAGPVTLIDDCYNANPVSVKAALKELADRRAMRRVVVLGEMQELGNHSPRLHREVGQAMKQSGVDLVIGVGEATRLTIAAAGAPESLHLADTEAALSRVPQLLRAGDTVLIKASRTWRFERLVRALRTHFGGGTKRLTIAEPGRAEGVPA